LNAAISASLITAIMLHQNRGKYGSLPYSPNIFSVLI
jgi:hypothetical protein